jgi:hypothetical protein
LRIEEGELTRRGETVSGEKSRPRWKKTGNRGPHVGEGKRDQGVPVWVASWAAGCLRYWAEIHPQGPFLIFLFFSSFSFSVFLFLLYLLQKCFKSIQTTFRNFLKINAMI